MPSMPSPNICKFLGCFDKQQFGSNFCEKHGAKRSIKYKRNEKLYNTSLWSGIRKSIMSIYPLCGACLLRGIVRQSDCVDHVFPHQQDAGKFSRNLFQGLCNPCHTQKTRLEQQGIYRHYTKDKYIDYNSTDYSLVVE